MEEPEAIDKESTDTSDSGEEYGLEAAESNDGEEAGLAPADPPDSVAASERSETETLQAELEEVQDLLRRKQAEFDNYRKRIEREQKEFAAYAAAEFVLTILPVLDNLERALESSDSGSEDQIREGVEIIYRQFHDTLQKSGLREVDALGEDFDPHVHEAVARVDSTDHREGEVLDVLQKGYFFKDRLLRPAMVKVGHNPSHGETDAPSESSEDDDD